MYDYILTFSDERRLVWRSRRSVIKVVFLTNRYLPIAASAVFIQGMDWDYIELFGSLVDRQSSGSGWTRGKHQCVIFKRFSERNSLNSSSSTAQFCKLGTIAAGSAWLDSSECRMSSDGSMQALFVSSIWMLKVRASPRSILKQTTTMISSIAALKSYCSCGRMLCGDGTELYWSLR